MSIYYEAGFAYPPQGDIMLTDGFNIDDFIEHSASFDDQTLGMVTGDVYQDSTPKLDQNASHAYTSGEIGSGNDNQSFANGYPYDMFMSTPPLSPSTTISSLLTEEYIGHHHTHSSESFGRYEGRDDIKKGKQPEVLLPEEVGNDDPVGQGDSDWYGMEYALDRSRSDAMVVWPPTAGEGSTSDAAFLVMYSGYIHPQDAEYWYEHWHKWHRALAREERRRRDRAVSDAKYKRAYQHAEYVQWEQAQRRKYAQQAHLHTSGSKAMASSRNRYRSSTCLF